MSVGARVALCARAHPANQNHEMPFEEPSDNGRAFMNKLLELTITAGLAATASGAFAGELPSFERSGFPITTHQVSVLGSSDVRERSTTPTLMLSGMPASPHQMAVLTPRQRTSEQQQSVEVIKPGLLSQVRAVGGH